MTLPNMYEVVCTHFFTLVLMESWITPLFMVYNIWKQLDNCSCLQICLNMYDL